MGYFEILCGIAAVMVVLYYYITRNYNFWKSRGVPGPKPTPPFGNMREIMFATRSTNEYLTEIYHEYKDEPMVGLFMRTTPILVLKDPELIKDVLIKDFSKFAHRGFNTLDKVRARFV